MLWSDKYALLIFVVLFISYSFNTKPSGIEDLRKTMVSYTVAWKAIGTCQPSDASHNISYYSCLTSYKETLRVFSFEISRKSNGKVTGLI